MRYIQPRVLFISRAYPPVIGGIERQNHELVQALGDLTEVELIANTLGKRFLPIFFVAAFFRGLWKCRNADVILLGDAVLAPLGLLLGCFWRKPVASVIHGLDITYSNWLYQMFWVRYSCPRLSRLFAVGNETVRQAVCRGIPEQKCHFIPNGVAVPELASMDPKGSRIQLSPDQVHLLTLGRLVERKGVGWFLEHVLPLLDDDVHYWIAGTGPCFGKIKEQIVRIGLERRVTLLGQVSEKEKAALLNGANVFVQPNIPVRNDMEGFGLVVLEAAASGLPVVASRLEGLSDAINEDLNGVLVPPLDVDAFTVAINRFLKDGALAQAFGQKARAYTLSQCLWSGVAARYLIELKRLCRDL